MEFPPLKRVLTSKKISNIADELMEKYPHVHDVSYLPGNTPLRFFRKTCVNCSDLVFFPTKMGCFNKFNFHQCPSCNPSVWISFCEENRTCNSAKPTCKYRDGCHPEGTQLITFRDEKNRSVVLSGCLETCI